MGRDADCRARSCPDSLLWPRALVRCPISSLRSCLPECRYGAAWPCKSLPGLSGAFSAQQGHPRPWKYVEEYYMTLLSGFLCVLPEKELRATSLSCPLSLPRPALRCAVGGFRARRPSLAELLPLPSKPTRCHMHTGEASSFAFFV